MPKKINIALCLSGGGFRASLFHLGALKRLHELGLLPYVRIISAVSGGAVTAALFHKNISMPENSDELKKKNYPQSYNWESFQTQLLQATDAGILGPYKKSLFLWVLLVLSLITFTLHCFQIKWDVTLSFLQIGIILSVLASITYLSLLPQASKYVYKNRDKIQALNKMGFFIDKQYFPTRLPAFIHVLILPFSTSMMRVTTLDKLFNHGILGELVDRLSLYLGTVELTRGREMIFSNTVLTELGITGSRDLWEERHYQDSMVFPKSTFDIQNLPTAIAVAASSAFPPIFRPITIHRQGKKSNQLIGVFSDGGLIDNVALNAPIDMFIYNSKNSQYFAHGEDSKKSFEQNISDIFIINAGASFHKVQNVWNRLLWNSWAILTRITSIVQGSQETNWQQKIHLLRFLKEPTCTAIGLGGSEFPLGNDNFNGDYAAQIRTHFDSFDPIETAVLVYSGYYQADIGFGIRGLKSIPLKNFQEIACEITGSKFNGNLSKDEIESHLFYSHLLSSWLRKYFRALECLMKKINLIR